MGHLVKVTLPLLLAVLASVVAITVAIESFQDEPMVFIRSTNWLMEEFRDHWIHILLTRPNHTRFEVPERPVSISVSGQDYQLPSRHLQVNRVQRLILLLMPQHNEPVNAPASYSDLLYEKQRIKMKDCVDRINPRIISYIGCFEFPNTYAVWTSG